MTSSTSLYQIKQLAKFYKADQQNEKSDGINAVIEKLENGLKVYVVTQKSMGVIGTFFGVSDAEDLMNSVADKLNTDKCYLETEFDHVVIYREKEDSIKDEVYITHSVIK